MGFDDVVVDLLKQGLVDEAEMLIEAASGMTDENQARQVRFFEKALQGTGVDTSTLKLDPKKRVMSFRLTGLNPIALPKLLDTVLRRVNSVGNTEYTVGSVERGARTTVEIKIGN